MALVAYSDDDEEGIHSGPLKKQKLNGGISSAPDVSLEV